jgi:hypothetical protein
MKQAQKVTTRFPIESDLGTDNIKRLSDLINAAMMTLNRACGSERAFGPIPPRSRAFFTLKR